MPGCVTALVFDRHLRWSGVTAVTGRGNLPLPRGASPTEAAKTYVYLMLNSYVTGQVLAVDGGGLLV
jgi:NAD(P)-dependent dehydrogenase (short-subunit alcohol dehydrogenase family)